MPRLEIPVRSSLRFVKGPVPLLTAWQEPESVVIEFEDRQFGWLHRNRFPHQSENEPPPGPTVTCVLTEDTDEEWNDAAETLQRLLSALAFHFSTRVESRRTKGGSGETKLLHPYGTVEPSDTYGGHCVSAPARVLLQHDMELRTALGLYREALSAGSPFYRFLAFWNVLDVTFRGNDGARDAFLRSAGPRSHSNPHTARGDVADYLRDDSRNAVAHIVRRDPSLTSIDPDTPIDRERLELDAYWLHDLARKAVLNRWPEAVALEWADGSGTWSL